MRKSSLRDRYRSRRALPFGRPLARERPTEHGLGRACQLTLDLMALGAPAA